LYRWVIKKFYLHENGVGDHGDTDGTDGDCKQGFTVDVSS
jgi:hypothetical protein